MNKQNPDRGIETPRRLGRRVRRPGMNKQNPDRGIETALGWAVGQPLRSV